MKRSVGYMKNNMAGTYNWYMCGRYGEIFQVRYTYKENAIWNMTIR